MLTSQNNLSLSDQELMVLSGLNGIQHTKSGPKTQYMNTTRMQSRITIYILLLVKLVI
jgi:hypothetical protein